VTGVYEMSPVEDVDDPRWHRMMAVNLSGTATICAAVVPRMVARGRGSIVTISSEPRVGGSQGDVHYAASKGAIVGFTRALATEVESTGVAVNTVAPGAANTPMLDTDSPWRSRRLPDHPAGASAGPAGGDRRGRVVPARGGDGGLGAGPLAQRRSDDLMADRNVLVRCADAGITGAVASRLTADGVRVTVVPGTTSPDGAVAEAAGDSGVLDVLVCAVELPEPAGRRRRGAAAHAGSGRAAAALSLNDRGRTPPHARGHRRHRPAAAAGR
jgi:hypothetical protein